MGKSGSTSIFKSKAVILASGGFESSVELREKFMGPAWRLAKGRGSRYNTGDPLLAALEIGAQKYGDSDFSGSSVVDSRVTDYSERPGGKEFSMRHFWNYGILVNKAGRRFVDEGEDFSDLTYGLVGKSILLQPGNLAFQIFDQKTHNLVAQRYSNGIPIVGNTIREVATKAGIDPLALTEEIQAYNDSVNERIEFNPEAKDGKSTMGINPKKSNWAVKVNQPPFVVYPVSCGISFTFLGLRVDGNARALDESENPIEGVYAAGEITGGFFYYNHPVGAGLCRGAVFGRIAGIEAAKFV